ncbi:MAG: vanadium-dependent haloperoxidase [Sphingobacteriaceae bacterium]|nr:vanadium-dependent haloperoxidase [Cytophagaceae bacterium]
MNRVALLFFAVFLVNACDKRSKDLPAFGPDAIGRVVGQMTDVMVHDVTNPPLAARFFAYACLAGYEVVTQYNRNQRSLAGRLNGYPAFVPPADIRGDASTLSALLAMLETARKLQPSGLRLDAHRTRLLDSCRSVGVSEATLQRAQEYAGLVSKHVLAYAKADRYNRISNYARYTPHAAAGHWYPTPPGYFAAVEPYFNTVRPLTLDTCNQFAPPPPAPFSAQKSSPFFKLLRENYVHQLSDEHRQIAAFWDCNPFALSDNGHLLIGLKKISPGAHWMGITGLACAQAKLSFEKAMRLHAVVAVGLLDGFIGCWDEKYRSHRIRPETAIRQLLDPTWRPFLQTPPFPEYVSGHSTISAAAATILTHYLGDGFAYTDTVEVRFGLKPRRFTSFRQAAAEAGVSRFYGGIHFRDAIENGRWQGERVGRWVLERVEKEQALASTPSLK